jgi:hypothetical protein
MAHRYRLIAMSLLLISAGVVQVANAGITVDQDPDLPDKILGSGDSDALGIFDKDGNTLALIIADENKADQDVDGPFLVQPGNPMGWIGGHFNDLFFIGAPGQMWVQDMKPLAIYEGANSNTLSDLFGVAKVALDATKPDDKTSVLAFWSGNGDAGPSQFTLDAFGIKATDIPNLNRGNEWGDLSGRDSIFNGTEYLYIGGGQFIPTGTTAAFVSDGDTPEPSTLVMWSLISAVSMSVRCWRRRRAA